MRQYWEFGEDETPPKPRDSLTEKIDLLSCFYNAGKEYCAGYDSFGAPIWKVYAPPKTPESAPPPEANTHCSRRTRDFYGPFLDKNI